MDGGSVKGSYTCQPKIESKKSSDSTTNLTHINKETPSCESTLNVSDVADKSNPKSSQDLSAKTDQGDSVTCALPDKDVCITITLDNGTGTIVEESECNSGITVYLGLEEPKIENVEQQGLEADTTGQPGAGPHLVPTAVSYAKAASCVHGEDAVYARELDGSEGHITEDGECVEYGIDATSMSCENEKSDVDGEVEIHDCPSIERGSKSSTQQHSNHACHLTQTTALKSCQKFKFEDVGDDHKFEHEDHQESEIANLTILTRKKYSLDAEQKDHDEPHKLMPYDPDDFVCITSPYVEGMSEHDVSSPALGCVLPDSHSKDHEKGSVSHSLNASTTEKRDDSSFDHHNPACGAADLVDALSNTLCEMSQQNCQSKVTVKCAEKKTIVDSEDTCDNDCEVHEKPPENPGCGSKHGTHLSHGTKVDESVDSPSPRLVKEQKTTISVEHVKGTFEDQKVTHHVVGDLCECPVKTFAAKGASDCGHDASSSMQDADEPMPQVTCEHAVVDTFKTHEDDVVCEVVEKVAVDGVEFEAEDCYSESKNAVIGDSDSVIEDEKKEVEDVIKENEDSPSVTKEVSGDKAEKAVALVCSIDVFVRTIIEGLSLSETEKASQKGFEGVFDGTFKSQCASESNVKYLAPDKSAVVQKVGDVDKTKQHLGSSHDQVSSAEGTSFEDFAVPVVVTRESTQPALLPQ